MKDFQTAYLEALTPIAAVETAREQATRGKGNTSQTNAENVAARAAMLDHMEAHGEATVTELMPVTTLSRPSVYRILTQLEDQGLVKSRKANHKGCSVTLWRATT
jgi:uncharacterized membrane protein